MDPNKQKAALALKNDTSRSVSEICQILGVCRNTYYKYIRSEEHWDNCTLRGMDIFSDFGPYAGWQCVQVTARP